MSRKAPSGAGVAQPDPFLARASAAWLEGAVDLTPFGMTLTWNTLLASAVNQEEKSAIDAGVDLLVTHLNLTAYTAAGTILASPDYLLSLFDASGPWTDGPHHVALWTGQNRNGGAKPYALPLARYVRGSSILRGQLTNLTATAARVDLGLEGWLISYEGEASRNLLFGRGAA